MGLRGRRAASRAPTAAAGTRAAAVVSQAVTEPPSLVWPVRPCSGTLDMPTPSVSRPNATAATGTARRDAKAAGTGCHPLA
jgi:hypothetical protein